MQNGFAKFVVFSVAFLGAVISVSTDALAAGGPRRAEPTSAVRTLASYEIRLVTPLTSGRVVVQVINKQTGELVTNARVSMRHWLVTHVKGAPTLPGLIDLEPDGHGGYVCTREHIGLGERVVIRAYAPGDPSSTWAELTIET